MLAFAQLHGCVPKHAAAADVGLYNFNNPARLGLGLACPCWDLDCFLCYNDKKKKYNKTDQKRQKNDHDFQA